MPEKVNMGMPQNIEAEEGLLGAVLSDSKVIFDIVDYVRPDDFYSETNAIVFNACYEVFNGGGTIDPITVSERLEKSGKLDKVGGFAFLTSLVEGNYLTANAVSYAKTVAEKATLRRLITAGKSIVTEAYNDAAPISDILTKSEQAVFSVTQRAETSGYSLLRDVNETVFLNLEDNIGKGGMLGVPTGFIELDEKISGIRNSDLIIVGARPGMGKTAFMLEIARYVAGKKKMPVAFFNLEMSKEQLATRLLSSQSGVSNNKLKKINLSQNDWHDLAEAVMDLSDAPIYLDDAVDASIQSIRARCRKLKMEKDIKLIIIDYLQLMTSMTQSSGNRVQEVSDISRQLKMMARELEVPIIVGSQLSRGVDSREDKHPVISDLRESGSIEQDADIVMFLYREVMYNKETEFKNVAEVIVAKHRNGEQGTVKLLFDGEHTTFRNMAK